MPTEMVNNQMPAVAISPPAVAQSQTKSMEQASRKGEDARQDAKAPVSGEALRKVVSEVAQYVRRDLNFSLDEDSGRTVVKVIDAESNEVVRQIPSEEMLALARRLAEMAEERAVSGEQAKGLLMAARV